ncbi:MAG: mannose-1-phosphate guanylyltransferase [Acidobacteria bacterium]|nr:mannose-1-phosphate guanylyltransferase [Acidobacteriota bacterium]
MAGGRGTRFWPRSRRQFPKQLMNLWGATSLLQQTVERLRPLIPPQDVWVFTNQHLVRQVARQLPQVPRNQIIAEPVQRNTGPCAGLAAELIAANDPEAILGVFPSDQVIQKPARFRRVVRLAIQQAQKEKIVVLGIVPRWPETGYGYIEFPHSPQLVPPKALPVRRFREKPPLAVARRYLRSQRFFWNSGMFFWKAETFLQKLRAYLPRTAAVLGSIRESLGNRGIHSPKQVSRVLEALYPACENISVDYAVLEKAPNVVGVACDIGWSDVGSWNALYDLLPHDGQGNVLRSQVLLSDSRGLLVDVPEKLVAGIGLEDLVVVETEDALLIARRERAQEVSRLVGELEKLRREDLL